MTFTDVFAAYCLNYVKGLNTLCGQNTGFLQ